MSDGLASWSVDTQSSSIFNLVQEIPSAVRSAYFMDRTGLPGIRRRYVFIFITCKFKDIKSTSFFSPNVINEC